MNLRSRDLIFWLTAFLLLLTGIFSLKPGAVWITDNGNKYIMMRNFAEGNGKLISHPVPELFPTGGFHFIKSPGGAVSFYPPYLSFITAPFYRSLGERGTLVFPLAALVLLLFLAWRYWHIPPPLLLLCTPLFFYGLLFWEMVPSTAMVLGTLLLFRKEHFFSAGACLALSLLMREEAYFVCAALGAALLFTGSWKDLGRFAAGFALIVFPIWGYQWYADGHFLGWHGKNYYLNNTDVFSLIGQAKAAFFNYYHHLFRFEARGSSPLGYLIWSSLLPLIAGALPGIKRWRSVRYAAWGIYLAALFTVAAGAWIQKDLLYTASLMTGLFTATPLIAGFMGNWYNFLRIRRYRRMTIFLICYILCVPPLMTAQDIGLVWGARHFLVILPLLCHLSFRGFRLAGIPRINFSAFSMKQLIPAGAVLLSLLIQLFGLYALQRISGGSGDVEQLLLSRPEKVIVTDVFYIPEQMPRLFFEKTILQVISKEDLTHLQKYLKASDHKEFILLLSPRFRRISDHVLKDLLQLAPLKAMPEKLTGESGFPDLFAGTCVIK